MTIMVLTEGDATKPSTWSNVPYLLVKELSNKGHKVINVNIAPVRNIITKIFNLFIKIIMPHSTYYSKRTLLHRWIIENKIKKYVNKYDHEVSLYINLSFDYSPSKYTKKQVLLLSDWPIDYAIKYRFNREPDWLEKKDIDRHKKVIKESTICVSLFKDVASYMTNYYHKDTHYISPLINAFVPYQEFQKTDNRNIILFIGKKSYYESAKSLIKVFSTLPNNNFELHIIGMSNKDFSNIHNKKIVFHGYLDKGNKYERNIYYEVLKHSKVVVNTSDSWAGMSSILESLYYYRPIITSKYNEFIKTFGNDIPFGYYSIDEQDLYQKLDMILSLSKDDYKKMSQSAHDSVANYTYSNFVGELLKIKK